MSEALDAAGERPPDIGGTGKIPYSGRLSNTVARMFVSVLGSRHKQLRDLDAGESLSDTGGGSSKRIDVAKRSARRGTELDVSIKTINFPDGSSHRFTKNMERAAREIGDEASALHEIMPYCVVVAVVLVRADACDDAHPTRSGLANISSFAHGVHTFRKRAGRTSTASNPAKCERIFLGYYESSGDAKGIARFFDVENPPPKKRRPTDEETLSLSEVADEIFNSWHVRWEPDREFAPD